MYKIAYNRATAKRLICWFILPFIIPETAEINLLTVLTIGWLRVLPGEAIAIGVIGLPLVKVLKKTLRR